MIGVKIDHVALLKAGAESRKAQRIVVLKKAMAKLYPDLVDCFGVEVADKQVLSFTNKLEAECNRVFNEEMKEFE